MVSKTEDNNNLSQNEKDINDDMVRVSVWVKGHYRKMGRGKVWIPGHYKRINISSATILKRRKKALKKVFG